MEVLATIGLACTIILALVGLFTLCAIVQSILTLGR